MILKKFVTSLHSKRLLCFEDRRKVTSGSKFLLLIKLFLFDFHVILSSIEGVRSIYLRHVKCVLNLHEQEKSKFMWNINM